MTTVDAKVRPRPSARVGTNHLAIFLVTRSARYFFPSHFFEERKVLFVF
jgi:hypothetical protein